MQLKLLLLIGILVCGVSYGAGCSFSSYSDACQYCKFDSRGNMNKTCYDKYIADGKTCIAVNHPILASKYKEGKCPQVDTCASQLDSCKSLVSVGNDSKDCYNPLVQECFTEADQCIDEAVDKCGGGLDLSNFMDLIGQYCPFVMILSIVLVGAVYAERR